MAVKVETSAPSLEQTYYVTIRSRVGEVETLLDAVSKVCDGRDARVAMLRATIEVLHGDVTGAIARLRRALNGCPTSTRPYLVDLLVPLLLTRVQYDEGEQELDSVEGGSLRLASPLLALRAIISAWRGNQKSSRLLAASALCEVAEGNHETIRARVLQRISLAEYLLGDFSAADNTSLEAAKLYESQRSFHHAAVAYSVNYSISHLWLRDVARARFYAERIYTSGQAGGDVSWQRYGLVTLLDIAVDSGDEVRLQHLRNALDADPLQQQYNEQFSIAVALVLNAGWLGDFGQARRNLIRMRYFAETFPSRLALCDALYGLFESAEWNLVEARRRARSAIARTAWRPASESLPERANRRNARIVAAATCWIIGDVTRGKRALSAIFDPSGVIAGALSVGGIAEEQVDDFDRGYVRLINIVAQAANRRKPLCPLTLAEVTILKQLPRGETLASISNELSKSAETVKKQVKSTYAKLGVSNRTQAIARAKELGIL